MLTEYFEDSSDPDVSEEIIGREEMEKIGFPKIAKYKSDSEIGSSSFELPTKKTIPHLKKTQSPSTLQPNRLQSTTQRIPGKYAADAQDSNKLYEPKILSNANYANAKNKKISLESLNRVPQRQQNPSILKSNTLRPEDASSKTLRPKKINGTRQSIKETYNTTGYNPSPNIIENPAQALHTDLSRVDSKKLINENLTDTSGCSSFSQSFEHTKYLDEPVEGLTNILKQIEIENTQSNSNFKTMSTQIRKLRRELELKDQMILKLKKRSDLIKVKATAAKNDLKFIIAKKDKYITELEARQQENELKAKRKSHVVKDDYYKFKQKDIKKLVEKMEQLETNYCSVQRGVYQFVFLRIHEFLNLISKTEQRNLPRGEKTKIKCFVNQLNGIEDGFIDYPENYFEEFGLIVESALEEISHRLDNKVKSIRYQREQR